MRIITPLILFLCLAICSHAQVDTINTTTNRLLLDRLQEGTSRYLVYSVDSISGNTSSSDVWDRTLSFGVLPGNNQPVAMFEWKWYRGEAIYRHMKAVSDRKTLAPLSEVTLFRGYAFAAYKFSNGFMIADSSVAGNRVNKNLKVALHPPVYNWELDMETFSLLPISQVGQKFAIAFMDPHSATPNYYLYEVAGIDNLALNKEVSVKCWLLRINYNNGSYAQFWISQQSHEVLKMKEYFNGTFRYKVKLY